MQPLLKCDEDLEVTERSNSNGDFLFVLNHSQEKKEFVLPYDACNLVTGDEYFKGKGIMISGKDAMILRQERL